MSPASYRKPWEQGVIWHLKEYWALYLFLGQAIWTMWFANFTLSDHSNRIATLEEKQQSEDIILTEIKTKLASIETSIKYIEKSIK